MSLPDFTLLLYATLRCAKAKWIPFAFLAFAMAKGAEQKRDTRLEQVFEP
jgi:hypothetical protein